MTAPFGYLLLAATAAYAVLAVLARRWWRHRALSVPPPAALAPVTVFKPLCGDEPRLYQNLRSYCTQDHPTFQLLFGLHGPDDAARQVVERLRAEFPALDIGVVIDPRVHGINLKVSTLINLLPHARHDWLLLADSDIDAPPDLLRRVSAPLARPATGVVTCLYRGRAIDGFWSRVGTQFIDDWFAPSVCFARRAGSTAYAFGATIALRRDVLEAAGGFEAIADCVADDWWLGEHTRRAGYATVLSECAVRTDVVETSLRDLAGRELRWLRAIRAVAPIGYAFSFVCWTTPMAAVGLALAGTTVPALVLAALAISARLALAADADDRPQARLGALLRVPVRDGLSLLLWTLALTGTAVRWRGRSMKIVARPSLTRRAPAVELNVNAAKPTALKTLFLQAPSFDGFDGGAGSRYQAKREIKSFWYPTWLAQPAALVPGSRVVDAPADELSVETVLDIAADHALVIVHTSTPSFLGDVRFAELLKARVPDIVIGMVGAKVAVDPAGSLSASTAIDFVAREEFDYTCAELAANEKPWAEITGISYRLANGRLQHNPPRATIEDMDALPFVAPVYRRDLTIRNYFIGYLQHPYVSLYTGRGCRSKCTFCLWPQTVGGHRYRVRSAANVIAEAAWIKQHMPEVRELMFDDDTFTDSANLARVHEIAIGLGKLGWTWSCNAKANVPYETLKLMKDNGLRLLLVGYESGDDGILHNIKKGLKAAIAERFTADCRRLGIVIHGTFILGLPGETRDTIEQTIEWAKRINPHTIQVSLAAPYPGTALHRQAVDNGWLSADAAAPLVNAQGVQLAALSYPHLSKDEIFGAMDTFYRRFYFRPAKIWEIVREMLTDWEMLKRRLREGVEFFRFLRERAV